MLHVCPLMSGKVKNVSVLFEIAWDTQSSVKQKERGDESITIGRKKLKITLFGSDKLAY